MTSFRVLQFNMQFGQRWDANHPDPAPIDLDGTIAEIRSHGADIVLLQEVEQATAGGRQTEPPPNYQRLRSAFPDYHGTFAYPRADERELPFGIGLAILSRTPLRDVFRQDIPSPPIEFMFEGSPRMPTDRLLVGARTLIGGRELTLLNTHLLAFFMLKSSSEEHGEQRRLVVERAGSVRGAAVVAGDFNVRNHASLVSQFDEAGFRVVQTAEPTWWRDPLVLDHVFYNADLRCVGHRVVRSSASDHLPILADFVFA